MIRILIADDHAVVRRGLHQILAEESDMKVVGEAGTSEESLAVLRKQKCDVVVLDINMPDKNGIETIKDMKVEFPEMNILVLSMHQEDQFGVRAFRAGASGYLTKDSNPDEMLVAIRKVASGKKYITAKLAELLEFELHRKSDKPLHQSLSDREFAVLLAIAKGKSIASIAQELFLSAKTVSSYRARVLAKMNMKSNAEIIHYAHHHSLLE
jgi:two-component system invasion response regulator UvrY